MPPSDDIDCDVLIVGGGLVGSLLANALSQLGLNIVISEARSIDGLEQPSFDGRATALANGSRRVLAQLGLWSSIASEAQPIRTIHVVERGRFGSARIEADEEGVEALGYTVENRTLGKALWNPLQQSDRVTSLAPAVLSECATGPDGVTARIELAGRIHRVSSRLLVAADGARSSLRAAAGIQAQIDDYGQQALIVNCTSFEPHRGRAFERFTTEGPLAVLPLTQDRVAIVWVLPTAKADATMALDDSEFREALQAAFGYRLGRFDRVGQRDVHPLYRVRSESVIHERSVLIGNAAVALHPVAGQGFNLALRDVASLAEIVADARRDGEDPGSTSVLDQYRNWRAADQRKLATFTHALVRGFGADITGLSLLRGLGLLGFDLMPQAKSTLARHTMGMAGRVPRLARQLNLHR